MVSLLRRLLPFLAAAVAAAVLYDAWVFYSRWSDARHAEQARREKEAGDARKTLQMLGGDQLKILDFYASPAAIKRGGQTLLCFGVSGASSVYIEPHVPDVHPTLSRCMQVSPAAEGLVQLLARHTRPSAHSALALQGSPAVCNAAQLQWNARRRIWPSSRTDRIGVNALWNYPIKRRFGRRNGLSHQRIGFRRVTKIGRTNVGTLTELQGKRLQRVTTGPGKRDVGSLRM